MKAYKEHIANNLFGVGLSGSTKRLNTIQTTYQYLVTCLNIPLSALRASSSIGQHQYDPALLFKMMFLQYLFNLSDRGIVEMAKDSLSFMNFLQVGRSEEIPEKTVLIRFRAELSKRGFGESLFAESIKQLKNEGIVIKGGAIIDSSIVEAKGRRTKNEKRRDKDARYARKHGTTFFGYKLHALVDSSRKAILQLEITPANIPDINVLERLVLKEKPKKLYADKGYAGNVIEGMLHINGIQPRILRKKPKMQELSEKEYQRNNLLSKVRARVEHVFGRMKNELSMNKVRYYDIEKNTFFLNFISAIYNAKVMEYNLRT